MIFLNSAVSSASFVRKFWIFSEYFSGLDWVVESLALSLLHDMVGEGFGLENISAIESRPIGWSVSVSFNSVIHSAIESRSAFWVCVKGERFLLSGMISLDPSKSGDQGRNGSDFVKSLKHLFWCPLGESPWTKLKYSAWRPRARPLPGWKKWGNRGRGIGYKDSRCLGAFVFPVVEITFTPHMVIVNTMYTYTSTSSPLVIIERHKVSGNVYWVSGLVQIHHVRKN